MEEMEPWDADENMDQPPQIVITIAEARKLLLNDFIPIWLEHLRAPCRTKDGKVIREL